MNIFFREIRYMRERSLIGGKKRYTLYREWETPSIGRVCINKRIFTRLEHAGNINELRNKK